MNLITGATGFLGSHLTAYLLQQQQDCVVLYRNEKKREHTLKLIQSYYEISTDTLLKYLTWQKVDILNIPALTEVFENHTITKVYHCAGKISNAPSDYTLLRKVNIEGTANVVNLSLHYKVDKLCHVSSIATLSSSPDKEQIDERITISEHDKNNAYAIAKYGAEREAWRGSQEGLNVVIVNPGVILGHGGFQDGSSKIIDTYSRGFPFYLEKITGFIGVQDCAVIMFQLMQSDHKNERYVLVSENLSFKTLAHKIAQEYKVKPARFKLTKLHLSLIWLGSIIMQVFGRKRTMTKDLITSLFKDYRYNHEKVKSILDYEFMPINEVIKDIRVKTP